MYASYDDQKFNNYHQHLTPHILPTPRPPRPSTLSNMKLCYSARHSISRHTNFRKYQGNDRASMHMKTVHFKPEEPIKDGGLSLSTLGRSAFMYANHPPLDRQDLEQTNDPHCKPFYLAQLKLISPADWLIPAAGHCSANFRPLNAKLEINYDIRYSPSVRKMLFTGHVHLSHQVLPIDSLRHQSWPLSRA
jgi:hypothetical protein